MFGPILGFRCASKFALLKNETQAARTKIACSSLFKNRCIDRFQGSLFIPHKPAKKCVMDRSQVEHEFNYPRGVSKMVQDQRIKIQLVTGKKWGSQTYMPTPIEWRLAGANYHSQNKSGFVLLCSLSTAEAKSRCPFWPMIEKFECLSD